MRLMWLPGGWADYLHWQETDRKVLVRINELIRDSLRSPFQGIGKPEPLRGNLRGWWSRRITQEHRIGVSRGRRGAGRDAMPISL